MTNAFSTEVGGASHVYGPSMGLQLVLRFLQFVLCLISFSVMASNDGDGAKFSDFYAYNFLIGMTFLGGFYAFLLTIAALIRLCSSDKQYSSRFYLAQLILDAIFVLFVWGAAMAAAGVATSNIKGQLGGASFCNALKNAGKGTSFCHKAEAAVAMCFFASFFFIGSFWLMIRATHRRY